MKKTIQILTLGLVAVSITACKHSAKDSDVTVATPVTTTTTANDDIEKETVTDSFGDRLEMITNKTKNTIIVRLNGESYEFHKNNEGHDYSTEDNQYQFSQTKREVTLMKKGIDMVLFHGKRNQTDAKLASH